MALLGELLRSHAEEPAIRVEFGRAQLAAGNPAGAEGSLRRAVELGASLDDVIVPLCESLIGQKKQDAALQLIGDPSVHPGNLRFPLTVLAAQARLGLENEDRRQVTRLLVEAFRLRADTTVQQSSHRDVAFAEQRLKRLLAAHELVRTAEEHFLCQSDAVTSETDDMTAVRPWREHGDRRVLEVGPTHTLRKPSDAAAVARDGDIILIDAGDYPGDVAVWRQNNLVLSGVGGRARLDAKGRSAANQGTWVLRGNDITVENIEFLGARAPQRNGSGIRFLGRNLVVRNSVFRDNEAGLLTWHDAASDVLVEHCVFDHNGYGDGQSHNIYIGRIRKFELRFSHSHDSRSGHEVKSRALENHILYNRLTDENDGNSSYLIDLPEGGTAFIVGNVLLKGARAENPHSISFATENQDVTSGKLWVVNNTLWNRYPYATFVRNLSSRPAIVVNNVVAGAPARLLIGPGTDVANFLARRPGLRDPAQLDFSLTADSPLIDAGAPTTPIEAQGPVAEFEYVHPANGRPRRHVGPMDIGAMEFCGW